MDALYFFRHSKAGDQELRFSLRSVSAHCRFIRKVWIFGDRPSFLSRDTSLIEHVPHERVAWAMGCRTPVTNTFLMFYLSSLIPDLSHDFLWFCDDYVVLQDLTEEEARRDRYLEDLASVKNRGAGLWKESLWRTYDLLKRLRYTGYNFETHVPQFYTRTRVFDAYRDLRDFVTEDRFYGLLAPTAILNHAWREQPFPLTHVATEGWKVGFYSQAAPYRDIVEKTAGKRFLNFDDEGFGSDMQRFLAERFPETSRYELEMQPLSRSARCSPYEKSPIHTELEGNRLHT